MKLFWDDVNGNNYLLGFLYQNEHIYHFDINEDGLNEALRHGCFGIGKFNILEKKHISNELFSFFKNRIPSEKNPNIEQFLNSIGLEFYDEFEILKRTHARLLTDRYYLND